MSGPDITRWMSTKNAAFRLGFSQGYVIRLARQGKLRAVETELGLLIDPESVDEYGRANPPRRRRALPTDPAVDASYAALSA